jgi:hypothetical protein
METGQIFEELEARPQLSGSSAGPFRRADASYIYIARLNRKT